MRQPQKRWSLWRWIRLTVIDPWQLLGTFALLGMVLAMAVIVGQFRHPSHLPKTSNLSAVSTPSPQGSPEASSDPSPSAALPATAPIQTTGPASSRPSSTPSASARARATTSPTVRTSPTATPRPAPRPLAVLWVSPLSGSAPLTVTADGSASTGNGSPITSYVFDFGDGSAPQTGMRTAHLYLSAGVYTVTLTVTNAAGGSTTDVAQVTVAP